jgi:hypothetical protein
MWVVRFWNWLRGRTHGRDDYRNGAMLAREAVQANSEQAEEIQRAMDPISRAPDPFAALVTTIWNERQWRDGGDDDPERNS